MTHPAADLLRAIADGKQMEYLTCGEWTACGGNAAARIIGNGRSKSLRIAREMVTRTVTYPAPLGEKPEVGGTYWTVDPACPHGITDWEWRDDEIDNCIFSAGMAFATSEDAEAAHKALFGGGV